VFSLFKSSFLVTSPYKLVLQFCYIIQRVLPQENDSFGIPTIKALTLSGRINNPEKATASYKIFCSVCGWGPWDGTASDGPLV